MRGFVQLLACLALTVPSGCFLFGDDDAEPSCDAPKVTLGGCGPVSPTSVGDQEFFGIAALAQESGWNVYWISEYTTAPAYRLQLARVSATGEPVGVVTTLREESAQFFLRGAVRLGTRSVFQLNRILPGNATSRPSELYVIEGDGSTKSIDLEGFLLLSAAPVFLDADTVAIVGIGGDGASTWLDVKVLQISSGNVVGSSKHVNVGAAFPAVPDYSYIESIAAVAVPGGIVAAWASTQRTKLHAARLDAAGKIVAGPVDLREKNDGGLYRPELALLEDGNVGVVWTASIGEEVRFRKVPPDLAGVTPSKGLTVNHSDGQQEHGRLVALPGGGALVVWGSQNGPPSQLRGVALGPSLSRCHTAKERELSCELASSEARASVLSARGNDVLVAWYDWGSQLVETRFLNAD